MLIEQLRRGTDEVGINNPITVLITIGESSNSDWTSCRDRITSVLEAAEFENAVSGRDPSWHHQSVLRKGLKNLAHQLL